MPHGAFVWNELLTNDVDAAKAFYAATAGWTYEAMQMGPATYWVAKSGGASVAGIVAVGDSGTPPRWFAYLELDDVDARIAILTANGGKLERPPFDIPGIGRIAIVSDPTGASLGWMTSTPPG
jgi:predicted enzyme related to lactoylglutathione lyase